MLHCLAGKIVTDVSKTLNTKNINRLVGDFGRLGCDTALPAKWCLKEAAGAVFRNKMSICARSTTDYEGNDVFFSERRELFTCPRRFFGPLHLHY